MINYKLEITPAILPDHRHAIEKVLEDKGYEVTGGGQFTDKSQSDITFLKKCVEDKFSE